MKTDTPPYYLTLSEIQNAAMLYTHVDIHDIQFAARWLETEWEVRHPNKAATFTITEPNNHGSQLVCATAADPNITDELRAFIVNLSQTTLTAKIMQANRPVITRINDATKNNEGLTLAPTEVDSLYDLITTLIDSVIHTLTILEERA